MFKKGKNGGLYSTSFSAGENQRRTAEKTMLRIVGSHGKKANWDEKCSEDRN